MTARLSALVVARNEEAQLGACLDRLGFADELVVVLDRSTDRSAAIARGAGARVIEGSWAIEGQRRNAGIAACTGDWILEIDADERVGAALAAEIRQTVATSAFDWHLVKIDNYVGDRLVRHGWGASFGRSAHSALFRKGAKSWGEGTVHPKIATTGREGPRLTEPLEHRFVRNISGLIERFDRYTTARAADLRAAGTRESVARNLRRVPSRFWKCYVGRKGHREGGYGLIIAILAGLYPLVSHLKATLEKE